MLNTTFAHTKKEGLTLLFLGAHCDDIEIGCGGTLLKMMEAYSINHITWIVFTSDEVRRKEAESSAEQFLESTRSSEVKVLDFKDGYLPSDWSAVKDEFEKIKESLKPDIIFTHCRNDLHQDHRVINELTWNTFRNHLIWEYEIAKYDGDLGSPNVFVTLENRLIEQKKEIILNSYESQLHKQWLDDTLLTSMMRIRGVESASVTGYAEAFYTRKMVF